MLMAQTTINIKYVGTIEVNGRDRHTRFPGEVSYILGKGLRWVAPARLLQFKDL